MLQGTNNLKERAVVCDTGKISGETWTFWELCDQQ